LEAILDPLANVIRLENLRGDMEENKAALAVVWSDSEVPELIIHGFWLVIDEEIYVVETLRVEEIFVVFWYILGSNPRETLNLNFLDR